MSGDVYTVEIQPLAYDDVVRNSHWWASHHSPEEALDWQDQIFDKIRSLAEFPHSHPLADENPDFSFELRNALFGLGSRPGYRILFTVVEQTVHVLTVRAAQEDTLQPGDFPVPDGVE